MYAVKINEVWELLNPLPRSWNNMAPVNSDNFKKFGIKKLIVPKIEANQKRGEIIYDSKKDVCTYKVIYKTVEELKNEELQAAQTVTAIQFIAQLSFEGISENDLINVINTLPEPQKTIALVSYKRANTFERSNPLIELVGKAFGKSVDDLNQIFINAQKI